VAGLMYGRYSGYHLVTEAIFHVLRKQGKQKPIILISFELTRFPVIFIFRDNLESEKQLWCQSKTKFTTDTVVSITSLDKSPVELFLDLLDNIKKE
jgi:hypothetical protein